MRARLLQLLVGAMVFMPRLSLASCSDGSAQGKGLDALNSGGKDVCATSGPGTLTSRLGSVINTLFIVAGSIAVLIMIVGGIRYISSTGDSKRIQAAKDTILYAVLGLIIIILARAIVGFVINNISAG